MYARNIANRSELLGVLDPPNDVRTQAPAPYTISVKIPTVVLWHSQNAVSENSSQTDSEKSESRSLHALFVRGGHFVATSSSSPPCSSVIAATTAARPAAAASDRPSALQHSLSTHVDVELVGTTRSCGLGTATAKLASSVPVSVFRM
jgi:hypothetical protein